MVVESSRSYADDVSVCACGGGEVMYGSALGSLFFNNCEAVVRGRTVASVSGIPCCGLYCASRLLDYTVRHISYTDVL